MNSTQLKIVTCFLKTKPVEIIAGPARISYYIHAGALEASESAPLGNLVSERWKSNSIDWSEWDVETIERVLTWLCTRKYQICNPSAIDHDSPVPSTANVAHEQSREQEPADVEADETSIGSETNPQLDDNPSTDDLAGDYDIQHGLLNSFENDARAPDDDLKSEATSRHTNFTPNINFVGKLFPHARYTYIAPLLALAKLHHFANYHLCEPLQESTLQEIEEILGYMDCSQPHALSDLEELTSYVYENIPAETPSKHSARNVLSRFLATRYRDLKNHGADSYLFRGDDISADFARAISQQYLDMFAGHDERLQKLQETVQKQEIQIMQLEGKAKRCKKCRSSSLYNMDAFFE